MSEKDYYSILGVDEKATQDQIKKTYRALAVKYHPDKNPGDKKAEEKFKNISEAYYTLGDPERRSKYDNLRKMGSATGNFSSTQGFDFSDFQRNFSQGQGFSGASVFSDIFQDLFRESSANGRRTYYYSQGSSPGSTQKIDTDTVTDLTVPKDLAVRGGEIRLKLSSGRSLTLKVPAGTKNGQKMRLRRQGRKCPCCDHFGDLIIRLSVKR